MAYSFGAGQTHKIEINSGLSVSSRDRTIYARVKLNSVNTTQREIAAAYNSSTGATYAFFFDTFSGVVNNNIRFGFSTGSGANFPVVNWTSGFTAGSEHTLIATYDGSQLALYADADATAKTTLAEMGTPDVPASLQMRIGNALSPNTASWDGLIYEVAYWDGTALGSSDRAILQGGGSPLDCSVQPTHYWPFTADATDAVGSADGTVTGATFVNTNVPQYYGSAAVPAVDDDPQAGPGPIAVAPPADMVAGDLVCLVAQYRGSVTLTISETGGQSWTSETALVATNQTARLFWCRFNGSWSANPSVTNTTGTLALTAVMHVFRPLVAGSTWVANQAQSELDFDNSSTTITLTGQTTTTGQCVTLVGWFTPDNNTWGSLSGSGWAVTGAAQYRNSSGTDQSCTFAHFIHTAAGATGTVAKTQTAVGADAGTSFIISFAEIHSATLSTAAATAAVPAITATAAAGSTASLAAAAVTASVDPITAIAALSATAALAEATATGATPALTAPGGGLALLVTAAATGAVSALTVTGGGLSVLAAAQATAQTDALTVMGSELAALAQAAATGTVDALTVTGGGLAALAQAQAAAQADALTATGGALALLAVATLTGAAPAISAFESTVAALAVAASTAEADAFTVTGGGLALLDAATATGAVDGISAIGSETAILAEGIATAAAPALTVMAASDATALLAEAVATATTPSLTAAGGGLALLATAAASGDVAAISAFESTVAALATAVATGSVPAITALGGALALLSAAAITADAPSVTATGGGLALLAEALAAAAAADGITTTEGSVVALAAAASAATVDAVSVSGGGLAVLDEAEAVAAADAILAGEAAQMASLAVASVVAQAWALAAIQFQARGGTETLTRGGSSALVRGGTETLVRGGDQP